MPLEIRELVIKANLESEPPAREPGIDPREIKRLKESIIRECVRRLKAEMGNKLSDR